MARISCSASVVHASLPSAATCRRQPISCASRSWALSAVGACTSTAALPASALPSVPPQANCGARLSDGSLTRTLCVRVAVKPSRSVAVTRRSIRPGVSGVNRRRPAASSATLCQGFVFVAAQLDRELRNAAQGFGANADHQ